MSASEALPRPQVCPACAIPQPEFHLPEAASPGQIVLSLPGVHCAACISTVENRLAREPGIRSARVNLSLKRVAVDAGPGITADHLVGVLAGVGAGAWPDVDTACDAAITVTGSTLPQTESVAAYQRVYDVYRGLYPALKSTFDALAEI